MQKIYLFTLFTLLSCLFLHAQSPSFAWAKSVGGTGADLGRTLTQDAQGNLYVAGQFQGTVDFDPGSGQANLVCSGASDHFILKLDANGDFVWVRQLATGLTNSFIGLSVDGSGNVFVGGTFTQTGDFDPGPGTHSLSSNGQADAFLVKLDPQGNFSWAAQFGSTQRDDGNTVVTDQAGNVYLTGRFDGTVDFDPKAGVHNVTSQSSSDGYILKLNTNGDFQWVAKIEGLATTQFTNHSLRLDAAGNIYLAGSFFGTADMDPGPGVLSFTSLGNRDVFILKLMVDGSLAWAKQVGGSSVDHSFSIFVDDDENVYTCGSFAGSVDFDPGSGSVMLSPTSGGDDHFLLKLDDAGDYVWAKVLNPSCGNIWVNASKEVFLTGAFIGSTDMDPGAGVFNLVSNTSSFDAFVLKLDSNGDFIWAGSAGGAGTDFSSDLLVDAGGSIYAAGYFEQSGDFDPDNVDVFNQSSSGEEDVFVLKWDEMPALSIDDHSMARFTLFPNPTQQNITLQSQQLQGEATLSVWDALGQQKAYYSGLARQEWEIEIPGPPGLYFIQLDIKGSGKRVWKVVKR